MIDRCVPLVGNSLQSPFRAITADKVDRTFLGSEPFFFLR
jgi:hypothetical protein